ncbi:hypothetical protein GCM10027053_22270 [Intrasporangium mesophilum]
MSSGRSAPGSRRSRGRGIVVLLGAVVVLLLGVLLWPRGTDLRRLQIETWVWLWAHTGRQPWFTPDLWSVLVNVAAFFVPACLAALLIRRPWWTITLVGLLISSGAEAVQALALPGLRVASVGDVLANGTGALVGALVGSSRRRRGWS